MAIPKRLIYCWFGGKELPDKVKICLDTWKAHMPDWEILRIDETNFNVNINEYCSRAYEKKAWAYVSDVARIWALYEYGGIYMDTDVICYKSLEKFLNHKCFTGFEQEHYPVTATLGAEKGSEIIKEILDIYNTKKFETHENWHEYETNTMIMSDIIGKYIDRDKEEYQESEKIVVYPRRTFCYTDYVDGEDVYTRHCMFGSWFSE